VAAEIFGLSHKYLLAIRTPCSGDYAAHAERISREIGLELRWMDVALDHMERVLAEALNR